MTRRSIRRLSHGRRKSAARALTRIPPSLQKSREEKDARLGVRRKDDGHHQGPHERQRQASRGLRGGGCRTQRHLRRASRDSASGRTSIRTADFAEALLNTSFDWNGAREPYILATENDTLNGLGMMFMKLLTNRAQIFADVRTYWSPEADQKGNRLRAPEGSCRGTV